MLTCCQLPHGQDIHARRSGWRGWLPSWGASSKSQRGKRKSSEGHRAGLRAMSRDVGAAADAAVAAVDADLLADDAATAEPIDAVSRPLEPCLQISHPVPARHIRNNCLVPCACLPIPGHHVHCRGAACSCSHLKLPSLSNAEAGSTRTLSRSKT